MPSPSWQNGHIKQGQKERLLFGHLKQAKTYVTAEALSAAEVSLLWSFNAAGGAGVSEMRASKPSGTAGRRHTDAPEHRHGLDKVEVSSACAVRSRYRHPINIPGLTRRSMVLLALVWPDSNTL